MRFCSCGQRSKSARSRNPRIERQPGGEMRISESEPVYSNFLHRAIILLRGRIGLSGCATLVSSSL